MNELLQGRDSLEFHARRVFAQPPDEADVV